MTQNLASAAAVKELCSRYGFTFSKKLGQNFLINPNVCPEIARQGGAKDAGVLEIGPGFGVLTRELARLAQRVAAVEIDETLLPVLEETLAGLDNVKVVAGDALKLDLARLIEEEFHARGISRVVVCANLPYYVTTPILMGVLEQRLPVESVTVMVQKEAADRLCAQMGTRACGAVTAAVRYYSEPEVLFPVGRNSFMPPPGVDSCVIRLNLKQELSASLEEEARMFALIRAAFSQRRKMLANPVSGALGIPKEQVREALSAVGLSPSARAEELTLEAFQALSRQLAFPS